MLIEGWVSVNDRLPKPGQRVDICRTYKPYFKPDSKYHLPPHRVINLLIEEEVEDGEKYIIAVDTRNIPRGSFGAPSEYCHLNGDYSHWMPTPKLPENYQEEQEKCLFPELV